MHSKIFSTVRDEQTIKHTPPKTGSRTPEIESGIIFGPEHNIVNYFRDPPKCIEQIFFKLLNGNRGRMEVLDVIPTGDVTSCLWSHPTLRFFRSRIETERSSNVLQHFRSTNRLNRLC
jgi:hypothetical protein